MPGAGAIRLDRKLPFALRAERHVVREFRFLAHDDAAGRDGDDVAAMGDRFRVPLKNW
jgi:hypothetical protein